MSLPVEISSQGNGNDTIDGTGSASSGTDVIIGGHGNDTITGRGVLIGAGICIKPNVSLNLKKLATNIAIDIALAPLTGGLTASKVIFDIWNSLSLGVDFSVASDGEEGGIHTVLKSQLPEYHQLFVRVYGKEHLVWFDGRSYHPLSSIGELRRLRVADGAGQLKDLGRICWA